ncbi:MAG: hypothetical protein ACOCRX_06345 [Candidatus Woesearchaeota archaeon]
MKTEYKILIGISKGTKKWKSQQTVNKRKEKCIDTQTKNKGKKFMKTIFKKLFEENNKKLIIIGDKKERESEYEDIEEFYIKINGENS